MSDLIDREKALVLVKDVCEAILSCCDSHYDEETEDEVYSDIREVDAILKCNKEIRIAIKNIPPAQPERKTGRWIIEPGIGCKCNRCGFDIGNDLDWMEYVNFCPNCGSDNREESHEKPT